MIIIIIFLILAGYCNSNNNHHNNNHYGYYHYHVYYYYYYHYLYHYRSSMTGRAVGPPTGQVGAGRWAPMIYYIIIYSISILLLYTTFMITTL